MKRFFTLVLGTLAMLTVALISAFIAMRLAIHGREVDVPALAGLTIAEADTLAHEKGLGLNLENRFYSTEVPAGHVLSQFPASGTRVRRDWELRITESLGAQRVNIPDLTGETERAATVGIRRLSLELGSVAHLPAPGDPGTVLTQTPPANSGGVDGPRVSLLIADPLDAAPPPAYVMPSLIGLSYGTALARAATLGAHLVAATPDAPPADTAGQTDLPAPAPPPRPSGNVMAQSPLPGRRIQKGDAVHVTLGHPSQTQPAP
jgi:beta-lactam-binding protein with PASTA domain